MRRKKERDLINKTIAKNLKEQRFKKDLSQEQLATKVGLTQSSVARIETCNRKMLAEELPLFAKALQININDLVLEHAE